MTAYPGCAGLARSPFVLTEHISSIYIYIYIYMYIYMWRYVKLYAHARWYVMWAGLSVTTFISIVTTPNEH